MALSSFLRRIFRIVLPATSVVGIVVVISLAVRTGSAQIKSDPTDTTTSSTTESSTTLESTTTTTQTPSDSGTISSSSTTISVPFAAAIFSPQENGVLAGQYELKVEILSGTPSSISLNVVDSGGSSQVLSAQQSAVKEIWSITLDTTTLANGTTEIHMSATGTDETLVTEIRTVTIDNGVTVTMASPLAGDTVRGTYTFIATTSRSAASVSFSVTDTSGATVSSLYGSQTGSAGTDWSVAWDSRSVVNGQFNVKATASEGGLSHDSASVLFTVENIGPLSVSLTYPASGNVLNGTVTLEADAPQDATSVQFNISWTDTTTTSITTNISSSSGGSFALTGSYDKSRSKWVASWDTRSNEDRDYQVSVTATRGTETVTSNTVTVIVMNGEGTGDTPTVTVTLPSSGTSVTGSLTLQATSSASLQDLSFSIDSIASLTSGPIVVSAIGSADGTQWEATWDSNEVPNGDYSVVLRSAAFGVQDLGIPVSFSVNNMVTSVQLTAPQEGQELSGRVTFSLVTLSDVESARFLVEQGAISESVDAQFDFGSSAWNATFDTTTVEDGDYRVIGETTLAGQTFRSVAVNVSIANGTADGSADPVMLLSPADGMTLTGEVSFQASVDRPVTSLSFFVAASSTASSFLQGVSANFDESGGIWTAKWQSDAAPNGSYDVTAVATISNGSKIGSDRVAVVIQNDTTQDGTDIPDADTTPTETVMSIRIVSPQSGPVEGRIDLIAVTEGAVQDVVFIIRRPGEADEFGRRPAERTGNEWRGSLETGNLGEGNLTLVAIANEASDHVVSSAVDIYLPGVGTAVGTDGEDVSDAGEDQTDVFVPLSVTVTHPASGDVRGITRLSAQTAGPASAVEFHITRLGAATPTVTRTALFVQKSGQWSALWDTTKVDTGEYIIRAFARGQDGTEATSIPFAVKVDNISIAETDVVDVIDTELIVDMVKELPEGTLPVIEIVKDLPPRPVIADIVMETIGRKVRDECTENGISEDRCESWLAKKHKSDECSAKGIVTREDCIAYLKVLHGGEVPGCQGKSAEDCAEVETRVTAGLLFEEVFERIKDAVTERINTVIRLEIDENDEVTAVPIDDIDEELAEEFIENIPLKPKRWQRIAVRVHASPSFAKLTGTTSARRIPAVLLIDSDGDGLPDDLEKRLGTDPTNADTDGDGFSDHTEVKNGFNPLGQGRLDEEKRLAPVDRAIVAGIPIEQPTEAGDVDMSLTIEVVVKADDDTRGPDVDDAGMVDENDEALVFTGTGTPGDTVTIFVYSYLPVILTTTVGEDGTWTYALDSELKDGQHEAFVTVTDDTGRIRSKSNPLAFFISEAQAVTEDEFYGVNTLELATEPINRLYWWYAVGTLVLVLIALVLGVLIFSKPSGGVDDGPAFS